MGGVGGSALQEATAGTWGGLDLLRMLAYSGLPDPAPVSFPHCCLGSCMPPPNPPLAVSRLLSLSTLVLVPGEAKAQ